jgi:hypothetical protein
MNATNPITIDGKTYDRYSMTLAVSGRYTAPDQPDASVVLTLTPTRFEGDQIEQAAESRTVLFGSLAVADDDARAAVSEVQAALQKFILAKGL